MNSYHLFEEKTVFNTSYADKLINPIFMKKARYWFCRTCGLDMKEEQTICEQCGNKRKRIIKVP